MIGKALSSCLRSGSNGSGRFLPRAGERLAHSPARDKHAPPTGFRGRGGVDGDPLCGGRISLRSTRVVEAPMFKLLTGPDNQPPKESEYALDN